jgi:hypothetical protein
MMFHVIKLRDRTLAITNIPAPNRPVLYSAHTRSECEVYIARRTERRRRFQFELFFVGVVILLGLAVSDLAGLL